MDEATRDSDPGTGRGIKRKRPRKYLKRKSKRRLERNVGCGGDANRTPGTKTKRRRRRFQVSEVREPTRLVKRNAHHPVRKVGSRPRSLSEGEGTPKTGREREVIPPGGKLKSSRARRLFGEVRAGNGTMISGHIHNNPAVSRKGVSCQRVWLYGTSDQLSRCSYCGKVVWTHGIILVANGVVLGTPSGTERMSPEPGKRVCPIANKDRVWWAYSLKWKKYIYLDGTSKRWH